MSLLYVLFVLPFCNFCLLQLLIIKGASLTAENANGYVFNVSASFYVCDNIIYMLPIMVKIRIT